MSDRFTAPGHEIGQPYLSSPAWLPPACSPGLVVHAIREHDAKASRGRVTPTRLDPSNVVERLAIAHALNRSDVLGRAVAMEMLESLGYEVSPDFAELGDDAWLLMRVMDDLAQERLVDQLHQNLATRALGRLWQAAFSAPSGVDQYITRSVTGAVSPHFNFFIASPPPGLSGQLLRLYLLRIVDLLQAAIGTKDLPSHRVGPLINVPSWTNPVARIHSGREGYKPAPIVIHKQLAPQGPHIDKLSLRFVDSNSNESIALARMTILRVNSGLFEDLVDIASAAKGQITDVINGVFTPEPDVFFINPRVRRLLDGAENRVFSTGVLEGLYIASSWRGRSLGLRMICQMLIEADSVEMLFGSPGAFLPTTPLVDMPFGMQAAYAAAKLRIARYWAEGLGAEYLFNGVMGMSQQTIFNARQSGNRERIIA